MVAQRGSGRTEQLKQVAAHGWTQVLCGELYGGAGDSLEVEFLLDESDSFLPRTSADWIRFSTA